MNWYSAKLLFEAEVEGDESDDRLCEESIRILLADDDRHAQERASEIGAKAEHQYLNDEGRVVRWRFKEVLDIQDICEPEVTDGMEVFSQMLRKN